MSRIFKGINIVLTLILVVVAAGVAYVALPFFGNQALIVRSGSMQPTIDIGSIVVVREQKDFISPLVSTVLYKVGNIIAFRSETNSKTLITHRIASIETGENGLFYKTKGDANDNIDSWQVSPNNVLGKVHFTLPYVGRLLAFAKSDIGFPSLIIFPAVFVAIIEFANIIRELLRNKKKRTVQTFGFTRLEQISEKPRFRLGLKILIPIVIALALTIPIAIAQYVDTETSASNIFQASNVFPTATPTPTPTPQIAQTLVVNEFLWNSSCGQNANAKAANYWIELYNGSALTVNLKDWQFKDANNNTIQISNANKFLDPGEYIIITKDGSVFTGCYTLQGTPETANLGGNSDFLPATTGGVIKLEQPDDSGFIVIDRVEYGPSQNSGSLDTSPDQSIARTPNGIDTALGDTFNAVDFSVDSTISPGVSN